MEALIAHLVGDYLLQNDHLATKKTKCSVHASLHAFIYSCCFLWLAPSFLALVVIFTTHFFIDRFRLARYYIWLVNQMPKTYRLESAHGFQKSKPDWLAFWLLIIVDNTMHLLCNYAALTWL